MSQRTDFRPKQVIINAAIGILCIFWVLFAVMNEAVGIHSIKILVLLAVTILPLILSKDWLGKKLEKPKTLKLEKTTAKSESATDSSNEDFIPFSLYLTFLGIPIGGMLIYGLALSIPFSISFIEMYHFYLMYIQGYGMLLVFLSCLIYEWINYIKSVKTK